VNFDQKKILLGLTGSIAIYKSAGILRDLIRNGAEVKVIMTRSAQHFMSKLVFETLSGHEVFTDMFSGDPVATRHIDLAKNADVILVCPATANIMAKMAHGIADDFLSTVLLAAGHKVVLAPAMNVNMYQNAATQANIQLLAERGCGFIAPGEGELACKDQGKGRLADEHAILCYLDKYLNGRNLLKDKKVVVTAGPTREYIDPTRFISNPSSGKMGYAIAAEAVKQGAQVLLISGPVALKEPAGVDFISVNTAAQMLAAISEKGGGADFLFMAAAVEDLCPVHYSDQKIKKSESPDKILVQNTPDIVSRYRKANPNTCIIGFSVESQLGKSRSVEKLQHKKLDYIAWNDPSRPGAAFSSDTNEVTLFSKTGAEKFISLRSKGAVAAELIEHISANHC